VSASHAEPAAELRLFEAYGIEIEYMIVDRRSLSVLPVADRLLEEVAGQIADEYEAGALGWSNELAAHVIELKTARPSPTLANLHESFQADVRRIDGILAGLGGRLMPTAMHPWMDPQRETRLWPHGDRTIYQTFDRIFGCQGHGWSNLQSMHLNLPFADDAEFARLHAAVRFVLPLLPGLAASSPLMDGRSTGTLDNRLAVYRDNARRVPSVTGAVIPEPVYSRGEYQRDILERIHRDMAPHDPEGVLRHEWINARGAIARFDRHAIEIRVLDTQECPLADIAVAALVSDTVRALAAEAWCGLKSLQRWDTGALAAIYADATREAERAAVTDRRYLEALGFPERGPCRAQDLWQHLIETLKPAAACAEWGPVYARYLARGTLARRILRALPERPDREALFAVYGRLCDCLAAGAAFDD
jgi:gamma-glutamyl:cysteine ligase YbdK (ATP-grasp superfamily)